MGRRKILIVDDDRDQRAGLEIRLKACGYDVVGASDAVQAVSVVRKESPDLVLLDIGLPGGDGHMVLRRLHAMTPTSTLPIIVLSAMDPAAHRDRIVQAGAVAYFRKPADNTRLLAAIRQALGEEAPASAAPTAEAPGEAAVAADLATSPIHSTRLPAGLAPGH
ncbi:MAG: response regulator transcription factor [Acidobacteriota bacterium]|nr:response regulator transcription factor [Acidobacteriota bacterium]